MSNTFWAVFLGASLGMFTVNLATTLLDEWQHRKHRKNIDILWDKLEDFEFDDED